MRVFVSTRDSRLLRLEERNGECAAGTVLERVSAHAVAAQDNRVLLGTRGGTYLSLDGGDSWQRATLTEEDVFSVAISAANGTLYAGTEPSRLFSSRDGERWEELEALQDIPSRPRWSFPPRPWTHHVRWIAPDPHRAERLPVGIELGGLMCSDDDGVTFTDHRPGAKRDTHSVAWHPEREGFAYQAAGDGAAISHDGGLTWQSADQGRDLPYCWALGRTSPTPKAGTSRPPWGREKCTRDRPPAVASTAGTTPGGRCRFEANRCPTPSPLSTAR